MRLCWFGTFAFLAITSVAPLSASAIAVDDNCGGTPQVGTSFSFVVSPSAAGASIECLDPTVVFNTLELIFPAPPTAADTTCSSTIFTDCSVAEEGDQTEVIFEGGSGLPVGVDFRISLVGFTVGETIAGLANTPEPSTFQLAALIIVGAAITCVLRRAKPLKTPDRRPYGAVG